MNVNTQNTSCVLDRFIPSSFDSHHFQITNLTQCQVPKTKYCQIIQSVILNNQNQQQHPNNKLLHYNKQKNQESFDIDFHARQLQNFNSRTINTQPIKILDAPEMIDDFYLKQICWSQTHNILGVCLNTNAYLWHGESGDIDQITQHNCQLTSVEWKDQYCLLGDEQGNLIVIDPITKQKLTTMQAHENRITNITSFNKIITTASRDNTIKLWDLRQSHQKIGTFTGHHQEVCGLSWNCDKLVLASGANDNLIKLWDLRTLSNINTYTSHQGAVKALAFCPFQRNILASGGGTADRQLKIWNTDTGSCIQQKDTGSQICDLLWNNQEKELITAHGYSKYQITVWKYPQLNKVEELRGHNSRVLNLTFNPQQTIICSAAADETLRFWQINQNTKTTKNDDEQNSDKKKLMKKEWSLLR